MMTECFYLNIMITTWFDRDITMTTLFSQDNFKTTRYSQQITGTTWSGIIGLELIPFVRKSRKSHCTSSIIPNPIFDCPVMKFVVLNKTIKKSSPLELFRIDQTIYWTLAFEILDIETLKRIVVALLVILVNAMSYKKSLTVHEWTEHVLERWTPAKSRLPHYETLFTDNRPWLVYGVETYIRVELLLGGGRKTLASQ